MTGDTIVFSIFLIFFGAALLSTAALFTRQSLLVVYIVLGIVMGPWGLGWVGDSGLINQVGEVGIIFLLFLLGLNLHPQNLFHLLRKAMWATVVSSLVFAIIGFKLAQYFGYGYTESVIIGAAMMFSSTIIGLKLLPTTILHHQHIGEIVISFLLLQDLLAIVVLLLLHTATVGTLSAKQLSLFIAALPLLVLFGYLVERYVLVKLINRFEKVQEYVFLLSVAWCLGMAELAKLLGLSAEVGAFLGGVSLAASPISLYIAESLKPLRDFFLVLFFFSIGASFNIQFLHVILVPSLILSLLILLLKPVLFRFILGYTGENKKVSWEVGIRLGQISEFSLLIAYLAASTGLITDSANYLIQATTIFTFIASSYIVVWRYPTPLALRDELRQN